MFSFPFLSLSEKIEITGYDTSCPHAVTRRACTAGMGAFHTPSLFSHGFIASYLSRLQKPDLSGEGRTGEPGGED